MFVEYGVGGITEKFINRYEKLVKFKGVGLIIIILIIVTVIVKIIVIVIISGRSRKSIGGGNNMWPDTSKIL